MWSISFVVKCDFQVFLMASDNIYGYVPSNGPDGYVSPMSNLYLKKSLLMIY